ncbi:MAG: Glycosytransferase [uncultured bacterium]|nr:MAG: Glycosytransferase [uncultured bacterium]
MSSYEKILMIGPDINCKGGISSVIELYKNSDIFINGIKLLSTYKEGNIFYKNFVYLLFLIRYVAVLSTDSDIGIVHIHTSSRGSFLRKFIALNIAKLFNKQVLLHIHGSEFNVFYEKSSIIIRNLVRYALNKSDTIITLSSYWQSEITKICQNEKIKVLYNPIVIKEAHFRESENINVLFMGRLGKRKGIPDILEAAKRIKSDNIRFYLYGDGDIESFRKLIKTYNLEDKVFLLGWVSGKDKEQAFRNTDIYFLPSYSEGLPISILEAMANSLPIISTPVGGISEAVKDNINGFLVKPGDYISLAEKIEILANDKDLRYKMGIESFRIAKEKFDIAIISLQLKNLYEDLLNNYEH